MLPLLAPAPPRPASPDKRSSQIPHHDCRWGRAGESCSWEGAFRENVLALTPEGGKGETGMRHSSPLLLI